MGYNLKILPALVLICQPVSLGAAFDLFPLAPLNSARGLMYLNGSLVPGGIFHDPASITGQNRPAVALSQCDRFGIQDLDQRFGTLLWPLKSFGLGLGFSRFGNRHYEEMILTVVAGKQLFGRLGLGLGVTRYWVTIDRYGSSSSYGLLLGWRVELSPLVSWGGALRNLNSPVIGADPEALPQVIVTGFQARIGNQIQSQVEWEQDTGFQGRFKFGLQYDLLSWLNLAGGYAANPGQATAGLRFHLATVNIDYAIASHPQLGFSQWVGLSIYWPEP